MAHLSGAEIDDHDSWRRFIMMRQSFIDRKIVIFVIGVIGAQGYMIGNGVVVIF